MPDDRHLDFVFLPADLAEAPHLPLELRKEIIYLHARLTTLDHWQLLGVAWNAPPEAVRAAYTEKVKLFHPDRHAGRPLGTLLPRLEQVFRALTEARDVLCDPHRRAEYARRTAPPDEFARLEARRLDDEARARERRARLARSNPLVARAARLQELLDRGKRSLEEGRAAQAANDFLTVLGLDPRNAEARALADEARRRAGEAKARDLYDRAVAAEAVGNVAAASAMLQDAARTDPRSARYAIAAARLALAAGDLGAARAMADQAVHAGPREASAHEALAAVLHAQGETREARRALARALELDPGLESARALSRKLRWSFLR